MILYSHFFCEIPTGTWIPKEIEARFKNSNYVNFIELIQSLRLLFTFNRILEFWTMTFIRCARCHGEMETVD
jgi:hypothetical protein